MCFGQKQKAHSCPACKLLVIWDALHDHAKALVSLSNEGQSNLLLLGCFEIRFSMLPDTGSHSVGAGGFDTLFQWF